MNINKGLYVFLSVLKGVGIFCYDHLQSSHKFPRDCVLMETGICPSSSIVEQKQQQKELEKEPLNMLIHSPDYSPNEREIC